MSLETKLSCSPEPVLELENELFKSETLNSLHCKVSSRSVFASSAFSNAFSEALTLSFLGESKKKDMSSDPKIPTASRVTTSRLFPKNMSLLKLLAAFPTSIPKGNASTIS